MLRTTFCFLLIFSGACKDEPTGATDAAPDAPSSLYNECSQTAFPAELRTQIQQKLNEYPDIPGAVIGIYHSQHGYVHEAFGDDNVAESKAMTVEGIFDVGSVHKTTKWVLMERLVEQGDFTWGDSLSTYVNAPMIEQATLEHLAMHATGMVDIGSNFIGDVVSKFMSGDLPYNYSYSEMMNFLVTDMTPNTTNGIWDGTVLGSTYKYSSYGPTIAGKIMADEKGQSLNELVHEFVLDPLELRNTSIIGYDTHPSQRVQGYGNPDEPETGASDPYGPLPDEIISTVSQANGGALFSTGCDMVNYATYLGTAHPRFLSQGTIDSRTADPYAFLDGNQNLFMNIGRGMMNYVAFGAGDFWAHAGDGMSSHASLIGYNPVVGFSAAILVNLEPDFIENEHGFHHEVVELLNAYY